MTIYLKIIINGGGSGGGIKSQSMELISQVIVTFNKKN